jgi:hypothetical protein
MSENPYLYTDSMGDARDDDRAVAWELGYEAARAECREEEAYAAGRLAEASDAAEAFPSVERLAAALRLNSDPPYLAVATDTEGKFDYLAWAAAILAELAPR